MPTSLIYNWEFEAEEIQTWTEQSSLILVVSESRSLEIWRIDFSVGPRMASSLDIDVAEEFFSITIIRDESQAIKESFE